MLTVATIQSYVGADIRANGREVRALMTTAAAAGARLAHLPEGALSGYPQDQDWSWKGYDWPALTEELQRTAELAGRLGLWTLLGGAHRRRAGRPFNSLYLLSDTGTVAGRYDKRMCSNSELSWWFSPGAAPLAFDVDGVRVGCAMCIEVVFPQIFAGYAEQQVDCVLLSSFSSDPIHGVMAQAHAATNCIWLSQSTPVGCSATLPATMFGPDGRPVGTAPPGTPGMVLHTVDPDAPQYQVPLRFARPWRARARSGEIYRSGEQGRDAPRSGAVGRGS